MIYTLLGTILYGMFLYLYACPLFREIMELDLNLLWVNWAHTNQHLEMEAALFYIGKFLSGYAVSHFKKTVFFTIAVLKSQIYFCFRDQR
jgi:hypothetical protein